MAGNYQDKWTVEEIELLRIWYDCGTPLKEMKEGLEGKSIKAISKKARRLFLKHGAHQFHPEYGSDEDLANR